jgi:hypothetical protein
MNYDLFLQIESMPKALKSPFPVPFQGWRGFKTKATSDSDQGFASISNTDIARAYVDQDRQSVALTFLSVNIVLLRPARADMNIC